MNHGVASAGSKAAGMPFFLPAATGQRFCILHEPAPSARLPIAIVYVHPFGEEMNRSRRMAALQARALAGMGATVLQIDLHGCGDSSDDFGDARWASWKADLALAQAWLAERSGAPVSLWGVRLGALLALDHAREAVQPVAGLLLWQPVTVGKAFLTQFLRLRLAHAMLDSVDSVDGPADGAVGSGGGGGGGGGNSASGGTGAMRAALARGEALEIGGYLLAPELAMAIDAASARDLAPVGIPVDWFEIQADPAAAILPATSRVADAWRAAGIDLRLHPVGGPAFWSSAEITEAPALIAATLAAVRGRLP